LETFLAIVNSLNVPIEVVVASKGHPVSTTFLRAEQWVDMDVLEVGLKSFLRLERSLGKATGPIAVLLLAVDPSVKYLV
jgi:hypothetical protein